MRTRNRRLADDFEIAMLAPNAAEVVALAIAPTAAIEAPATAVPPTIIEGCPVISKLRSIGLSIPALLQNPKILI